MKLLYIALLGFCFAGCSPAPKKLGAVEYGMSKPEVVSIVGEPAKKNVVNKTEIWDYPDSSRTIVFRMDTVYSIITSAKARADSMGLWLDSTNSKAKNALNKIDDGVKRAADKVKGKLRKDSTNNK